MMGTDGKQVPENGHDPNGVPDGHGADARVPAVDDVIMQSLGERWETAREMLEYPTVMSHAIPRAVLTERDSVDLLRSSMLHALWQTNTWDPMQLSWQKMALSIPVEGRGRKEAVEIATSAVARVAQQREVRDGPKPR